MVTIEKLFSSVMTGVIIIYLLLDWQFVIVAFLSILLLAGSLYSVVADYLIEVKHFQHKTVEYLYSLFLYAFGGVLVIALFQIVQGSIPDFTLWAPWLFLGVFPALLYFHVMLVFRVVFRRFYD
ncbi:hypothetical protein [Alkalibacillus aidingensis]|uniref:hypothetical protein n=1 Tax=Alkalibacillus aidingensis TaxID=2747607 RepID=UPI0016606D32|nr:hypothetical protein [Alkalibacillus aidingensis]